MAAQEVPAFVLAPPPSLPRHPGTGPVAQIHRSPFSNLGLLVDGSQGTATTAWLAGPNTIITAGHCLHRPGRSGARCFYFALQYSQEQGGYWSRIRRAATLKGWACAQDHRYDWGICTLDHRFSQGGLSIPRDLGQVPQDCLVLGYAFGGAKLWQSRCRDLRWTARGSRVSAGLTEGCSGGPWLAKIGNRYRPVGITSRGSSSLLLSPAWGPGLFNLLEWASQGP